MIQREYEKAVRILIESTYYDNIPQNEQSIKKQNPARQKQKS